MLTTLDIMCCYQYAAGRNPDNQLLKVKYAFNLETLISIGTYISQITQILKTD